MKRDLFQAAALFLVIMGALVGLGWIQHRLDVQQQQIACISANANIVQISALREISETLGLPTRFTVPPLPPECNE